MQANIYFPDCLSDGLAFDDLIKRFIIIFILIIEINFLLLLLRAL